MEKVHFVVAINNWRVRILEMKAQEIESNVGKKVIVKHRGLLLVGTLVGRPTGKSSFGERDAKVQLPAEKKPRRFFVSKISLA